MSKGLLIFCTAFAATAQAAVWDGGRLLVEANESSKALRVEDNVAWLEAGKVPDYAVGNVIRWLELKGVDCTAYRARFKPVEPPLGEPLSKRPGFRLGFMLDISRDKVPTMASLKRLVDALARFGYNELQLYTEVTFAYAGHEEMWRGWSPMTAAEIRELDAYCWARGIVLTPNQNSFGHLEKLFRHARYLPLAEAPNGFTIRNPPLKDRPPKALHAAAPESMAFLAGLYDELFPLFPHADRANVGCDEVWDIFSPTCRSAGKAARFGVFRVYADHLKGVYGLCSARKKRMAFWADMVLRAPGLLEEIPRDALPINWGYGGEDADSPGFTCEFEGRCLALKRQGLDFYVGPSTCTWAAFFGRHRRMRANLDLVTAAARKYGACGLLLTSWGDHGHRHPWFVDLPGIVYAAAKVRGEEMTDGQVAEAVDGFCGCRVGKAVVALGNIDRGRRRNEDAPTAEMVAEARAALAQADVQGAPEWVRTAYDTLALGADILEARVQGTLVARLAELSARYSACWLKDNRPGGLEESLAELGLRSTD